MRYSYSCAHARVDTYIHTIHTYIHTIPYHTIPYHTGRQAGRQAGRLAGRQAGRQTDLQLGRAMIIIKMNLQ